MESPYCVHAMRAISRSKAVHANLTARRVSLGLTQKDVALRVGRARETVNRWENGKTDPTSTELSIWASALGCGIEVTELVTLNVTRAA